MASSSTQNMTHSILDHPHMRWLLENARGYEAYAISFWSQRLQMSFPEPEWAVMPEQYVALHPGRGDKRKMDTYIAYYDGMTHLQIGVMVHEAKREKKTPKEVESQALEYAKDVTKERMLASLWIITTIGTRFRTWNFVNGAKDMKALFGGKKGEGDSYIEAETAEASNHYAYFIHLVKTSHPLMEAPTLPSQSNLLATRATSTSGSHQGNDGGQPIQPLTTTLPWHQVQVTKYDESRNKITFSASFPNKRGEIEYMTLQTDYALWTYDDNDNCMFLDSPQYGCRFYYEM